MAEFSLWTRVGATLLLVALSLAAWTWLQAANPPFANPPFSSSLGGGRASAASKAKKKTKKRAKKAATAGAQDNAPSVAAIDTAAVNTEARAAVEAEVAAASESEDGSEDEGLSAVQILARRKFKTKVIGGRAAAALAALQQAKLPKYEPGQHVLARFQNGSEWFPATIVEVRRGNEYNLKYDDGEVEYRVLHKLIKPLVGPVAVSAATLPTATEAPSSTTPGQEDTAAAVTSGAPPLSSSDEEEEEQSDEDDGWAIVGASANKARTKKASGGGAAASTGAVDSPRGDPGLTKRQRESRRKKERQKEIKELARVQAQGENGLHAKWGGTYSKMKYVPPPTQT